MSSSKNAPISKEAMLTIFELLIYGRNRASSVNLPLGRPGKH